ncbi:MAG: PEGA domain-containing protein [Blastocatellia bacterium]|nr:PEGA domain-containing protein [Blastocatellia bacterium]
MGEPGLTWRRHGRAMVIALLATFLTVTATLLLTRERASGLVNIATDPPKATVFIDGRWVGHTPLVVELTAGTHRIVLQKEGYKPIEREIFADPSEPEANYDFSLEPVISSEAPGDRQERIRQLKLLVEEALRRGDYVAPENENALYYLNQLQRLAPDDPFISEVRERIRRILRQQAETSRRRKHLS